MSGFNGEKIVKIGLHLRKLSQKQNWGTVFLDHPVSLNIYIRRQIHVTIDVTTAGIYTGLVIGLVT